MNIFFRILPLFENISAVFNACDGDDDLRPFPCILLASAVTHGCQLSIKDCYCDCSCRWQTSYWGDCSRTCNGGVKRRHVRCVQFGQQSIEYEVDESLCGGSKPANQEVCNREPCPPEWVAQPFGEVRIRSNVFILRLMCTVSFLLF